jgi:hypothetical protein
MLWPGGSIADLIRSHLLDEFDKHSRDPWWWPLDPATDLRHWGLSADDKDVAAKFASLCPSKPNRAYPGFLGSLGATPGCVFIIGERPSFGKHYAHYVGALQRRLILLRRLPELVHLLNGHQPEFHVTDLIKFRGQGFNDSLSERMIAISLNCLRAEYELLKPKIVLLTCMAEERLPGYRRRSKLQASFDATQFHWLLRLKAGGDRPLLIDVPHWSKGFAEHEWESRVRDAILTSKG